VKRLRILIIGTGSIGRRHITLLKKCGQHTIVAYRRIKNKRTPGVDEYIDSLENLKKSDIDCAVICNPSSLHVSTALILARQNIPFLMEKPVCVDSRNVSLLQKTVSKKRLPVLVGFNMRYHILFEKMKTLIESKSLGSPISMCMETGYYLPNWRSRDYKKCYSAHKNMGGGVIFDLTHEIDIAVELMGSVREVSCIKGNVSSLKTTSEDIAEISLMHKNKRLTHIHLDYIQKTYTRTFKIVCEQGEIIWDYGKGTLSHSDGKHKKIVKVPPRYSRDDTFKAQMKHWLNVIAKKEKALVSLRDGITVSNVAIAAHRSAEKKKVISL